MINSFENYVKGGDVKRKTPDMIEASSLFYRAVARLSYAKLSRMDPGNAVFIFEDAYEAARESAQALMSAKGFKPYSHEATISFIKEFYGKQFNEGEIFLFDRFRQLRNDSVYRAADVSIEDAASVIAFAEKFIARVKPLLPSLES